LARLPNTNNKASMTFDFPLPLGPTILENRLWNGPISCSPAYDLKFSKTIVVIINLVVLATASDGDSIVFVKIMGYLVDLQ
jgi:hypothetical protein